MRGCIDRAETYQNKDNSIYELTKQFEKANIDNIQVKRESKNTV